MANEVQTSYTTGATLYFQCRNSVGQPWNHVTQAFETFTLADWADYALPMTEETGAGYYMGSIDAAALQSNMSVSIYVQAGGSAASSDLFVSGGVYLPSVGAAASVTGAVGSVAAPVTLPTSVPAAYATSANQTTILNAVNTITSNVARAKMVLPTFMARPSTGLSVYAVNVYLYNLEGHLEDADSNTITIAAANAAGGSLNAGLSSTTMTRVSTGLYTVNYTVSPTDATGEVIFSIAWSINAVAMSTAMASMVEDAESLATLAAIEAKTNLIGTNSADSPNAVTAQNTITLNLNASVSSRSVYAGTDTPGTTTLLGRLPQALLFDTSGFVKADTESIIGTPPTLTGGNLNVNATNMITLPAIYSAEVIGGGTVTFTGSLFTTSYESGATVYMIVYNSTGAVYTPSSGQFFSYAEPNWQYYAIAAAEQRPTGFYSGVFPTIPAGNYTVRCFAQAGASPAATDYCFAAATYLPNTLSANLPSIYPADVTEWDGVTVTTVVPNTASVTLATSQSFNNTGQTTDYPVTVASTNVTEWNGMAITTAVPNTASVTLATSQSFNNTGQTTDYPVAISGNGAYVVTAPVVDQNGVALQSVTVSLSANGYTYTALTNSSGIAGFNLNAATYTVAVFLAGYNLLSLPANAVVSSAMTLPTISLTKQTIAQPSVCQCTGTLYSSFGPVAGASVAFQMILPPPGAPVGVGETNAVVTATTDTDGLLTTNNGLNNYVPLFAGATYSITWGIGNQLPPFLVPSASTANLPAMVGS